jgi:asparagine synthase (glutamine-hydrolysing)
VCGISGCFYSKPADFFNFLKITNNISRGLNHRGPDKSGIYFNKKKKIILAHRRLSVLDLSRKADQPMFSRNKKKVITYNGEIYNHQEIREFLKSSKYKINWQSSSDTETLIEAMSKIGLKATLKKTRGMFAFALFDTDERALYLVRDRFGEKPLYYYYDKEKIFFFSEIIQKNFFQQKLILDTKSISFFLKYNFIKTPNSIYKNIKKVQPGTYIKFQIKNNEVIKKKFTYWKPKIINKKNYYLQTNNISFYSNKLENILKLVVKDNCISDVPLGVFLSGGVDSSLIASIASKIFNKKINTFSLGLKNDKDYSELIYAEKISKYLKTNHKSFEISNSHIIDLIEDILDSYDEPFSDSSQILTYILCKFAKNHVKVVLTGDGGDEMFGGYNRYIVIYYLEKFMNLLKIKSIDNFIIKKFIKLFGQTLSPKIISLLFSYSQNKHEKIKNILHFNNEIELFNLLTSNNNYLGFKKTFDKNISVQNSISLSKGNNLLSKFINTDVQNYLPDDLLVKVDRASMSFGLECRAPFLDLRVYNFSQKIPMNLKIRNLKGKYILRKLLCKYLPLQYLAPKKMGFSFSLSKLLMNKEFYKWSGKLISNEMLRRNKFINYDEAKKIVYLHFSKKNDYSNAIWSLIVLQNWLKKRNYLGE